MTARVRRHLGCGCSSVVEHDLAKVGVEGSSPFARSRFLSWQTAGPMTGRLWAALSFLGSRCDGYSFFQTAGDSRWRVGVGLRRNVMAFAKLMCRSDRHADDQLLGFGFSRGGFTNRIVRIHILWKLAHASRVSLASRVCCVQILRCSAFRKKYQNQRDKNFPFSLLLSDEATCLLHWTCYHLSVCLFTRPSSPSNVQNNNSRSRQAA